MNKVMHLFTHMDLRSGHPGLRKYAAKMKIKVDDLTPGEFVLFMNKARTGMKLFAANNTVIYIKSPNASRPFDIAALHELPSFIDGSSIGYDKALYESLSKRYAVKRG